jgi:hypothetical protein
MFISSFKAQSRSKFALDRNIVRSKRSSDGMSCSLLGLQVVSPRSLPLLSQMVSSKAPIPPSAASPSLNLSECRTQLISSDSNASWKSRNLPFRKASSPTTEEFASAEPHDRSNLYKISRAPDFNRHSTQFLLAAVGVAVTRAREEGVESCAEGDETEDDEDDDEDDPDFDFDGRIFPMQ